MSYLAHTPPAEGSEIKPHLYKDHVNEALEYGTALFEYVLRFSSLSDEDKQKLRDTFVATIMLHDMGKLDDDNQKVLCGKKNGRLPVDHIEAGVAISERMQNELLGWLIRGHHSPGLPSKKREKYFIKQFVRETGHKLSVTSLRGLRHKRTKADAKTKDDYFKHLEAIRNTDENIDLYISRQIEDCGEWSEVGLSLPDSGLTVRLMLSCLVAADHGSTAAYSNNEKMQEFVPANTRWKERLQALDTYVKSLSVNASVEINERNELRGAFYQSCYSGELFNSSLAMCSAQVGLGKTTSVMAYLLRKSIQNNASRIFVIAPFTNIINQTVLTLRKAIVLPGEEAEKTVVAHHHKVEFSNKNMRQYATLWQAPVVVTTAVQFFETLSSAHPTRLRKLNSVTGASIFIDESHACLPAEFLKISWYWLKKLSQDWGCNIVFSSGSMVEFWNDEYLIGRENALQLPDLLTDELHKKAKNYETRRVEFHSLDKPLNLVDIVELLQQESIWCDYRKQPKPSCLMILNTVQSAAVVAYSFSIALNDEKESLANKRVLHLSTALSPKDRDEVLEEVERRQGNCEWNDIPWYLIATSCVEAGVDLDFAIGFRERCSVTSFLQVAGRINRHGQRKMGILYDFTIIPEDGLNHHPGFKDSSQVFENLWNEIKCSTSSLTELSTSAIRKEFSRLIDKSKNADLLLNNEIGLNFQEVDEDYRIINTDTATVIVCEDIVKKMESCIAVDWQLIQENSVQLWNSKISKLQLNPIKNCEQDNIYSWIDKYEYDEFLGIMAGVVKPLRFFIETGGLI